MTKGLYWVLILAVGIAGLIVVGLDLSTFARVVVFAVAYVFAVAATQSVGSPRKR
jgi:hypothetical protein